MAIGWFPGHMNKARREIQQTLRRVDAVIEILDARLPWSSSNPMLAELVGNTPCLKVLNKADLADPVATAEWLEYFQAEGHEARALTREQTTEVRRLTHLCYDMYRKPDKKDFRIMIVGIPNVGKSTYMNILLNRRIAKTGNEPAVTKARQEVRLDERISLIDTPGVLWPKLDPADCGFRLAASGAIRNTAFEFAEVALWTVRFLCDRYPQRLQERYQLDSGVGTDVELLETIGRQRGCLVRGGVDFTKAGEILLQDLRSGKLGRISLELPGDIPAPVDADASALGDSPS